MDKIKSTVINNGVVLEEYEDGLLFGTDALLLSRFVKGGSKKHGIDIGCGSGAISLLLLSENKADKITGIEIQEKYAVLADNNAVRNGFEGRFNVICGDARSYKCLSDSECADFVVSNPPFMKADSGKLNENIEKTIARHEEYLPPSDLCKAASYFLKYGGSFYIVYRPERICTLIYCLKECKLEPKRLCYLSGNDTGTPSLVLVEARKGGAEGVSVSFKRIK